ncbi:MAG TPA: hypothetical protein VIG77_10885 [Ktedonobacterales bacterium]
MRRETDNRMPPRSWWLLAFMTLLAFSVFCLVTHSWTPLAAGWPIVALIFALAIIRQGADRYERRQSQHHLGRRHAPHA